MAPPSAVHRLPGLIEAAAAVVGAGDLEHTLRRLVAEARTATGATYAALGIIGEHGVLTEFFYEGLSAEEAARIGSLPMGKGVLGTLVREKTTIRIDSIADHPESYGFPPNHPAMGNFLGVPVAAGGKAFGNLYLTDKTGGFTDDDVMLVEALSRIAGSAVTTARLQERLRSIAVGEDRERIARDLHDSVIQDLFAVGLGLQGIAEVVTDNDAATTLEEAVDRLDTVVEELRAYIFQLRSGGGRRQLDERLQELVSRLGSAYPTPVTLEIGSLSPSDERLEDEVVKIVTEALSNALRHSRGTKIEVVVLDEDGWYRIMVRDDGSGFDPAARRAGLGLANLSARASKLGGMAEITSSPGRGTTVEVKLPLS
ncbi:MAG TPA: GAF domain-containing sensor histidine kinase [Acidimicrobiia bacterium]|nr:GAF domain-containing sensor histidine kinase [Acidimicrobiia bacterium]